MMLTRVLFSRRPCVAVWSDFVLGAVTRLLHFTYIHTLCRWTAKCPAVGADTMWRQT